MYFMYLTNILQTKTLTCMLTVPWKTNLRLPEWSGKVIFRMSNNSTKYKKVMNRSRKQEVEIKGREHTDDFIQFKYK